MLVPCSLKLLQVESIYFLNEGVCYNVPANKGITALTQIPTTCTLGTLARGGRGACGAACIDQCLSSM